MKALTTAKMVSSHVLIMDNSEGGLQLEGSEVEVLRYRVPYTFSQSQNWARSYAIEHGCTHYYYLHTDCEAPEQSCVKLRREVDRLLELGARWGSVWTNYDTLCAYSVECMKVIGEWDISFPSYFVDNDYYRRMKLANYPVVDLGVVTHHVGSASMKSDPRIELLVASSFTLYEELYARKWGGKVGEETYLVPYNRQDLFG